MSNKKYVWLDTSTGRFTNSFTDKDIVSYSEEDLALAGHNSPHWKLIEYNCLTDNEFTFNNTDVVRREP